MAQQELLIKRIDQALGREIADLVIKNTEYLSTATGELLHGDIAICGDTIVGVGEEYEGTTEIDGSCLTVVPGFVDAHFHLESSMLSPYEFERCVLPRGTTTGVCDPHEMANVKGVKAIEYFLKCAENMIMDLYVKMSSCVPATSMETSGGVISAADLLPFKNHPKARGLAEMMNYPGVWFHDPGVMAMLTAFGDDIIDGHAPLLSGKELNGYLAAGIQNCHETSQLEEGLEKLRKGMRVFIRGGSVAKNLRTLLPLITPANAPYVSFCTDDRNPADIEAEGHLDYMVRIAIESGISPELVYRVASLSGAEAFRLYDRGKIAPGYKADLLLLSDYRRCLISQVIKSGKMVNGSTFAERPPAPSADFARYSLDREKVKEADFQIKSAQVATPVIGIIPNSIITEHLTLDLPMNGSEKLPVPEEDILKVAVLERHGQNGNIGLGFVKGFGLKSGALASSIGHDSHNICVVGVSDAEMVAAVNTLIDAGGGQCVVKDGKVLSILRLPLAGIMSDAPYQEVGNSIRELRSVVKETGCMLDEPFMQLAFLPLPVIPFLKLTDQGLVDVSKFQIIEV